MYQTLARILGTMILTWLVSHHYLDAAFAGTLTPAQVVDIGMTVIFVAFTLWAYAEKLTKGHITWTGKTITFTPDSNVVEALDVSSVAAGNSVPQPPPPPKPLTDKIDK